MTELTRLIAADEIPPGQSAEVVAAGRIFAVYNVDGTFHVLDGICPHAGGPLGKGLLHDCTVTCPWHGWQFDVTTGQHRLNAGLTQPAWSAEIEDGFVCIRLTNAS
ncbi:MAG: Rieske (2Fe-2S) protein [Planctomycetaceae bacterium]